MTQTNGGASNIVAGLRMPDKPLCA